jgi:hypothetical protein
VPTEEIFSCPENLQEGSYWTSLGHQHELWRSLRGVLPARCHEELTNCVFMLLKSDALVQGKHEVLLREMAAKGWQVVHARATLTAGPRHFEELYQYNLTVRNESNVLVAWWLNSKIYKMAPSIALLVRIPPDGSGRTAHQRVKDLKGPSDPFLGESGQLRWAAGAVNLALNLLHTSDDPISSVREFLIFGGAQDLIAALERASRLARSEADGEVSLQMIEEEIFVGGAGSRCLDIVSTLTTVKSRLRATENSPAHFDATHDLYVQFRELLSAQLDLRERWFQFRLLNERELALLGRLSSEGVDVDPLHFRLAAPDLYDFGLAIDIRVALMRRGIRWDEWDDLALDTNLYYSDRLPHNVGAKAAASSRL